MQARMVLAGVLLVPMIFAHSMIWVFFVVVVCANAQDAIFIKYKCGMKTLACLFLWPESQRYFDTFFQSLVH
jgi:hypothetical protein